MVVSLSHNEYFVFDQNHLALPRPVRAPIFVGGCIGNGVSGSVDGSNVPVQRHAGVVSR